MTLHAGDQRLLGHPQELRIEAAGQGHRPLDEGGDLVEERVLDDRTPAGVGGGTLHPFAHPLPPFGEIGDHEALPRQAPGVLARARQLPS